MIEKLQDAHCDMTRTTTKRFRVLRNIGEAAKHFPESEPILCIGSGDGFEIEVWELLGFEAVGIEISRAKRKIADYHGVISFPSMARLPNKYNVYCAHTLEHAEDMEKMLSGIRKISLSTVCLVFPIEPNGSNNPSHLSPIRNINDVEIPDMKIEVKMERWNDEREGFIILKKEL